MTADNPHLQAPPRLLRAGHTIHGHLPEERYFLPDLWALHHYRYGCQLRVDGQLFEIHPGSLSLIPPATPIAYRFPNSPCRHSYLLFQTDAVPANPVSAAFQPTRATEEAALLLHEAVDLAKLEPARAQSALWRALWLLSDLPTPATAHHHPALRKATTTLEANLETPAFSISALCAQLQISHNHLNRLFRSAFDLTAGRYLEQRRLERAKLLLETSDLPIWLIGRRCGYPDAQHFNKWIRSKLGCSPTAWRGRQAWNREQQ